LFHILDIQIATSEGSTLDGGLSYETYVRNVVRKEALNEEIQRYV